MTKARWKSVSPFGVHALLYPKRCQVAQDASHIRVVWPTHFFPNVERALQKPVGFWISAGAFIKHTQIVEDRSYGQVLRPSTFSRIVWTRSNRPSASE